MVTVTVTVKEPHRVITAVTESYVTFLQAGAAAT